MEETWSEGFLKNSLKAFKRYRFTGSLIRIKNSFDNPSLFFQHLKDLNNKQKVKCLGLQKLKVNSLNSSQDITDNFIHRQRLQEAIKTKTMPSSSSPIIVLDNEVHDGHHRIDICKRAGIEEVECLVYSSQL
jgi:hypothetical protein